MRVLPNVTKVWLNVILVLPYVMMKLSNVRKNNGTIKCDKSTVKVILILPNVTMELFNIIKKK